MKVKDLKEELSCYEDDMDVVFEVCGDFEPDSVTEDKWGNREVHLDAIVKPYFMAEIGGKMHIELDLDKE